MGLFIFSIFIFKSPWTVQGFIQDFMFGGEIQHLGGSGSMFPSFFLKTNALRLILGHFLVHMHILANTHPRDVFCCNYANRLDLGYS